MLPPSGHRTTGESHSCGAPRRRTISEFSGSQPTGAEKRNCSSRWRTAPSRSHGRLTARCWPMSSPIPETRENIWVLPLGGDPVPARVTPFAEHSAMFSPDGSFIAYVSDESGQEEVYVMPFPSDGSKYAVSTSGGREPIWSEDGSKIYFRGLDDKDMYAVSVQLDPTFSAARPELLFSRLFFADRDRQHTYDVSSEGRFLMVEELSDPHRDRVIVVLNFAEELKRLAPAE